MILLISQYKLMHINEQIQYKLINIAFIS